MMKLNNRLTAVSNLISQYHKGNILADIGTDHAYLPVYLSINHIIQTGYACDIAEGPLSLAQQTINKYHIKNVIPLLGSGITPILNLEVSDISICGMGGLLITEIISLNTDYLHDKRLFLQANTAIKELREFLCQNHFKILDETIIEDMGHIYEIIVCEYSKEKLYYDENDLIFGPVLLKKKSDVFIKKWLFEASVQQRILDSLDESHEAYKKAKARKQLIEEILNDRK